MNEQIKIELAQAQDAAAIAEVHYAAVHQTAKSFYPEEVIKQGFEIIEYATHQLASGQEMASVRMRKVLNGSNI